MKSHHILLRLLSSKNNSIILGLEPLFGINLGKFVGGTNAAHLLPPVPHVHARPSKDHIEVHTVDANSRVVLDTQVDVLSNTEAKVSIVREVFLSQLVLLHFESSLQDLFSLSPPVCDMAGNLLVPCTLL